MQPLCFLATTVLLVLGVAVAVGCAQSAAVAWVEVSVVPEDRHLRLASGLARGDSVDAAGLERARAAIERQLADAGYLRASVSVDTSDEAGGLTVRFRVARGEQARVGGWEVSGAESIPAERLTRGLARFGTRFTSRVLDHAVQSVLATYEARGLPLAQVTTASVRDSAEYVFPTLAVNEGPRVTVEFLEFPGRPSPKPGMLLRLARFRPGPYSRSTVRQWQRNLERSRLVQVDSEAIVRKSAKSQSPNPKQDTAGDSGIRISEPEAAYGVRFWLTGQKSNRATAAVGYAPDAEGGRGRFTGFARADFRNLFDTGRRLAAGWQSAYDRTAYELSYTEPWVLGTNVSLTGSAGQQTVDTTYAQMNLALAASSPAAAGTDVTLETGFDQYTDVVRRQSVRVAWAGTGAVFDTRDFAPNPHSGVLLSLGTRAGTRTGDSAQDAVVSRSKLDLAVAVPLRRAVSWSNGFAGRLVYSPVELSEPELCRLGGTGSLRGYREDEFASTTVGWWSSELRFLLDRLSRLYPFFDLGTYYDSGVWRLNYGYGAGAVAATAAGVFGFDYGIAFGESPLRGKVHLSFEAEF